MPYQGNGWKPSVISRFLKSIPTSTGVCIVETDQGLGFLKVMGNPEGPHALAAELVGSQLADWLGLPTLDFSIVNVSPESKIQLASGTLARPGPAFISRWLEQAFPWGGGPESLKDVERTDCISGIVVADTWMLNIDRYSPDLEGGGSRRINKDNVLLNQSAAHKGPLELIAMDFTHAFTLGGELRRMTYIERIESSKVFGLFPEFEGYLNREFVESHCQRLSQMTSAVARECIGRIPAEWEVSTTVRAEWANFVVQRAHFLAENLIQMLWPQQVFRGLN